MDERDDRELFEASKEALVVALLHEKPFVAD